MKLTWENILRSRSDVIFGPFVYYMSVHANININIALAGRMYILNILTYILCDKDQKISFAYWVLGCFHRRKDIWKFIWLTFELHDVYASESGCSYVYSISISLYGKIWMWYARRGINRRNQLSSMFQSRWEFLAYFMGLAWHCVQYQQPSVLPSGLPWLLYIP